MANRDKTDPRETWVNAGLKESRENLDLKERRVSAETTRTGSGVSYSPVSDSWPHRASLELKDLQDLQDPPDLQEPRV